MPLFFVMSLFISFPLFSQVSLEWQKFYGNPSKQGDMSKGMVADDLGNVYVTGSSAGVNNKTDYVTIKYNTSGEQQWIARYDGFGGTEEANAIAIDKWGNIYVAGHSETGTGSYDFATVKYNNAGVQLWAARFNGPGNGQEYAAAMKVDKDGNVYVSGFATVNGPSSDCAVIKYNTSGVLQWARYYNGTGNGPDIAFAMAVDTLTSDVYVTGNTTSTNYNEDYVTIKYSSAGVEQWVRTYNGTASGTFIDDAREIATDSKGNVYVSGLSRTLPTRWDCVTIKYDASGNVAWLAKYSGPGNFMCQPNDMITDKAGNVYITGSTQNDRYRYLCATLKYNSEGVQQWVQLYSSNPDGDNIGWSLALDGQDNIYVASDCYGGSSSAIDYITLKYNPAGMQQWVERYDVSNLINYPSAIAVNKFYDVFVTGSVRTYADNSGDYYDYATIKYKQPIPVLVTASPDTTVYYGYGSHCVQLKAAASGGYPPYNFVWSFGGLYLSRPSLVVCPTATTTYTVIVQDGMGQTATSSVVVKVIDVRCGNGLKKVLVCHKGKDLCIAEVAVEEHLRHGDVLGSCTETTNNNIVKIETGRLNAKQQVLQDVAFTVYPNPTSGTATISYKLSFDARVSIKLFDLMGREMTTVMEGRKSAGYYTATMSTNNIASGVYLCRMTVSDKNSQSTQTIKINVVK
jgi:uncharacterized delta-60 repeat protein